MEMNIARLRPSNVVAIVAAVLALFLGVAYLVSPFFALQSLRSAAADHDRDALSVRVDFPAVRASLKDQLSSALASKASSDPELKSNPFAGLAMLIVPVIVDRAVDTLVTPDAIAKALDKHTEIDPASESDRAADDAIARDWSFIDLDHFKVEYSKRSDPSDKLGLLFERRGLFTWTLVRLDLPIDELEHSTSSQSAARNPAEQGGEPTGRVVNSRQALDELLRETEQGEGPTGRVVGTVPKVVGECVETEVQRVSTRLQNEDGTAVPGSGSAIEYTNGVGQVSYDTVAAIDKSEVGDVVRLCLVQLPKNCPPGDNRGKVYHAKNLRTQEEWTEADSEHSCGGA